MKKIIKFSVFTFFIGIFVFNQSCNFDKCEETIKYQFYRPVFKTEEQLRKIEIKEAIPLENPGKIYVYGDYLFINELYKGIHVFDNTDVDNPINLSFISIVGNIDLAIKDDVLYADNFIDLLSFDISNPKNPIYLNSVKNVFNKTNRVRSNILIHYIPTDTFRVFDCNNPYFGQMWLYDGLNAYSRNETGSNSWNPPTSPNGVGGSMARFTILNDRLYTVDREKLSVFNISNPQNPTSTNSITLGWGIETIFPYKNNLFIGSNTGMYIYSASNPDFPEYKSLFKHARTCDPVFIVDDIAYVTLRSGNRCSGYTNQLDIIDIKSLTYPRLLKSYDMSNPHGLSVLGDKIILCEGEYGLKVLSLKNKKDVSIEYVINSKHFYDVIGLDEQQIILVGKDGLYQYKLQGYELTERSHIPIVKN